MSAARLDDTHRLVAVAECLGPAPVVDLGAGPCLLEPEAGPGYVATDVRAELLAAGPRRLVADVVSLPFRDGVAGTVTCVSVLQYVLDVESAVAEIHRVLRPDGRAVIVVPNLAYARKVLTLLRGRLPWTSPLDDWHGGTVRYFTRHDLEPMLTRVGFRVVDVQCTGRFRRLRSRWPSRLGAEILFVLEPQRP